MKKIFFLFFACMSVYANETLEVSLETKNALMPIYLSKIQDLGSILGGGYLDEIKSILYFDLNNSGYSKVLKLDHKKEMKLSNFDSQIAFDKTYWQNQKTAFVIKTKISKKSLKTSVYFVETNELKTFAPIELSGDLNQDRSKIHKLSDNLIETLFAKQGVSDIKILYTIRTPNQQKGKRRFKSEICICDFDGKNNKQLTFDNSYYVHPIFIPNKNGRSNEYIFVSYITGQPKIYKSSLNSSIKSKLVHLRGNQLLPSVSKNFEKLTFISDAAGRPDVFIQNFDNNQFPVGKPKQVFSYPRSTQASPYFSPDLKKLAFVSDKDGTPRIYVIKINDSTYNRKRPLAHLITKRNRQNVTPCWSKDGKKLVYSAKTNKVRQIWVYDFETDKEMQITKGNKNKENPIWAPNNLHVVYNTEDKNEAEVYIININEKKPIKITRGAGRKRFPYFEPQIK